MFFLTELKTVKNMFSFLAVSHQHTFKKLKQALFEQTTLSVNHGPFQLEGLHEVIEAVKISQSNQ